MALGDIGVSFTLGLITPLTAVCVLPLYPGFLSYLASKLNSNMKSSKTLIKLGLTVSAGVITFMLLLGFIFTTLLNYSLTNVIGVISPIAFTLLGLISILLIFNLDISRIIPNMKVPRVKNPILNAFLFGFFFGAIVIPCNPLFIAALFAKILSSPVGFLDGIFNFLAFGIGMALPLIVLTLASSVVYKPIIKFLTKGKKWINLVSGIIMLSISIYYLFFVFRILG